MEACPPISVELNLSAGVSNSQPDREGITDEEAVNTLMSLRKPTPSGIVRQILLNRRNICKCQKKKGKCCCKRYRGIYERGGMSDGSFT